MNYNPDCFNVYSAVGLGMSGAFAAGSYAYSPCASGNCTSRPAQARIYIDPVDPKAPWPSALALTWAPTGAVADALLTPASVVLIGSLSPNALYRCLARCAAVPVR
jgi:hypothetical protein